MRRLFFILPMILLPVLGGAQTDLSGETPIHALETKAHFLRSFQNPIPENSWSFLTGDAAWDREGK